MGTSGSGQVAAYVSPDWTEQALGIEGPGLTQQLNGGLSVEYGRRVRRDDVITAVTRLGSYHERKGRLGLMLFTTLASTWTNQRNETVKISRLILIRY